MAIEDVRRSGAITWTKRTLPTIQAGIWFASGILGVLQLRDRFPDDAVALCLPDMERYRNLERGIRSSLAACRVTVWLVDEAGTIQSPDSAAATDRYRR